jgi:hypothetical protein
MGKSPKQGRKKRKAPLVRNIDPGKYIAERLRRLCCLCDYTGGEAEEGLDDWERRVDAQKGVINDILATANNWKAQYPIGEWLSNILDWGGRVADRTVELAKAVMQEDYEYATQLRKDIVTLKDMVSATEGQMASYMTLPDRNRYR